MTEFQIKLFDEYKDLLEKIYKAQEYLKKNNDAFLSEQVKHMLSYATMLKVRFGNTLVDDFTNEKLMYVRDET